MDGWRNEQNLLPKIEKKKKNIKPLGVDKGSLYSDLHYQTKKRNTYNIRAGNPNRLRLFRVVLSGRKPLYVRVGRDSSVNLDEQSVCTEMGTSSFSNQVKRLGWIEILHI